MTPVVEGRCAQPRKTKSLHILQFPHKSMNAVKMSVFRYNSLSKHKLGDLGVITVHQTVFQQN